MVLTFTEMDTDSWVPSAVRVIILSDPLCHAAVCELTSTTGPLLVQTFEGGASWRWQAAA
eukprot:CAMPEP_0180540584 /NCGR_PEP_ID=MMETSP1036_2-20121128/67490_1 /TAXON_ID=632150 /ORGANISM="Azadinium spinosum, Strain 3D9" /LENGTH=59 /DNA_ID=CAMNT_0022555381 /DNA_START=115 /DNA_END=290 /DNA_ORIENTATION=-